MRESGEYALGILSTPPQELIDFFTCKTWGLPNGQGWLNELANYTKKISIAGNAFYALQGMTNSKNWVEWRQANPDLAKLGDTLLMMINEK